MNPKLLKGLFLTTGFVLGVFYCPRPIPGNAGFVWLSYVGFVLVSVAVFYGLFYLAHRRGINQLAAYLVAGVLWCFFYMAVLLLLFSSF